MVNKEKDKNVISNLHNIITSGTIITGKLYAEDNLRIDGNIEGDVTCKGKVIVGNNASINGNIECINIEIFGLVKGNIICHDTVILRSTTRLTGDVKTQTIEIEPGTVFIGSCSMITEEKEA